MRIHISLTFAQAQLRLEENTSTLSPTVKQEATQVQKSYTEELNSKRPPNVEMKKIKTTFPAREIQITCILSKFFFCRYSATIGIANVALGSTEGTSKRVRK